MSRLRWVLATIAAVLVGLGSLGAWSWAAWTRGGPPAGAVPDTTKVLIRPGMTLQAAADTLAEAGLLRHERIFLLGARLAGRDRDLQPGVFRIAVGASPRDLLHSLVDEMPLPVVVTVPEGLEADEVADLVAAALGFSAGEFLDAADARVKAAARAYPLFATVGQEFGYTRVVAGGIRPDGRRVHWCEGYLAPDTYHFYAGTAAGLAAQTMVELQLARVDSALALARRRWPVPPSAHDLVTLASIIEAEARQPLERPRVSAVYANRLRLGMKLEADPTVAFWLGKRGQRLLYADLEVDSPFNTYQHFGLPPGPIGSSGWASLQAAAQPESTCQALYFVADGEGGHVFSANLAAHQQAVENYREHRHRAAVDGTGTNR